MSTTRQQCHGCAEATEGLVWRCPRAGEDDVDHLLVRTPPTRWTIVDHPRPFRRFLPMLFASALAAEYGLDEGWLASRVDALDEAIAEVDGHGFLATPLLPAPGLAEQLGVSEVLIKNETGNVSGSHKARHLFGIALALEVAGAAGRADPKTPLAIASCGNAARAAAVIARAMRRRLQVFVPTWAEPSTVARLDELGAEIIRCPRRDQDPPGDPCIHRFREAVAAGSIAFGCQGPDNGLAIDGGMTLAWELVDQLAGRPLDRLFVQVGGGALASSVLQGLRWAKTLGALTRLPRVHAVQSAGCAPLAAAWTRLDATPDWTAVAGHRSLYMSAWPDEPTSLASGILDDETYDWLELCRGLQASEGSVLVAPESAIEQAWSLGRQIAPVCATGTAGLAGALGFDFDPAERVALLFTGHLR